MTPTLVLLTLLSAEQGQVVLVLSSGADPYRAQLEQAVRDVGLTPVLAPAAAQARSVEIREAAAALAQVQALAEAGRRAFYAARFDSTRELAAQAEEVAGPWRAHPQVRALLTELLLIREAAGERGALQRAAALMPSYVPSERQFAPSLRRAWARAVATQRAKSGQFTLATTPAQATVWLDGLQVDAAAPLAGVAGPIDVYAQAPGHAPTALRVVPSEGGVLRVSLRPLESCVEDLAWRAAQELGVEARELSACAETQAVRAVVVVSAARWLGAGPCVTVRERSAGDASDAADFVTQLATEAAEDCRLEQEPPKRGETGRESIRLRLGSRLDRAELRVRADGKAWARATCRVPCDELALPAAAGWRSLDYVLLGLVGTVPVAQLGSEDAPLRLGAMDGVGSVTPWLVAGVVGAGLAVAAVIVAVAFAVQPLPTRIVLGGPAAK